MTQVFASLGMSLDGFVAGPTGGPDNALGDCGQQIHRWMYARSRPALGRPR
jgi:hypothetical protein